ncbi:MAG: hypothetical protein H6860_01175 [Rhodospirillales bacterium]|nr:hypothetical protein [Alphaproteobacteria bacterium]MCB9980997.1 hypothetical protein [Rhodospirillales bacterium]
MTFEEYGQNLEAHNNFVIMGLIETYLLPAVILILASNLVFYIYKRIKKEKFSNWSRSWAILLTLISLAMLSLYVYLKTEHKNFLDSRPQGKLEKVQVDE